MSKIAGLKGRSPETYPSSGGSGLVSTTSESNGTPVDLTNSLTFLVPAFLSLPVGFRNIVLFSGVLENPSVGGAQVEVEIIINGVMVYSIVVEVSSTNSPVPFGLAFETTGLPADSGIDIQAKTVGVGQTATAATGSAVVISTPS